jgi:hypothetical protein
MESMDFSRERWLLDGDPAGSVVIEGITHAIGFRQMEPTITPSGSPSSSAVIMLQHACNNEKSRRFAAGTLQIVTPTSSEVPLSPNIEGHCLLVVECIRRGQERWVHTKQRTRGTAPVLVEVCPENFSTQSQIFHGCPSSPETKLVHVEVWIAGRGGICTSIAPAEQRIARD